MVGMLSYISLITSKIVTLIVGPKRKTSPVHKALICRLSEYFKKAFSGNFQEAQKNEIYLAEENPAAIELFIGWLYRGADALAATEKQMVFLHALWTNVLESTDEWFDDHPGRGLKALASLASKHYDQLDKEPQDRYGRLMVCHVIKFCLTRTGNYDDFIGVEQSNNAFTRKVAASQMLLLLHGRYGQKWMENFRRIVFRDA
ncbi:hypothetical protein MMC15_007482 [Xylographa vitiligo]|nr:hypothetical protein [Xylographa vitiligo]